MHSPALISTVVTPAASTDLIDLATLKTLLGVAGAKQDAYLKLIIAQASAAAANYCNRVFVVETLSDAFYPQRDGYIPQANRGAAPPAQLSRWPVRSVTSVVETADNVATPLVAGTDYLIDAARGQLLRLGLLGNPRPWPPHNLLVTYVAGYDPIPADLVGAVAAWIKGIRAAQLRDPMLRSQSAPGVYEASYWFGAGPGNVGGIPPDVAAALDNYSVPLIG